MDDSTTSPFLSNENATSGAGATLFWEPQQQHNPQDTNAEASVDEDPYEPRQMGGRTTVTTTNNNQNDNNLSFTTQDAAQRAVLEVLAHHNHEHDGMEHADGDDDDDDDDDDDEQTITDDDDDEMPDRAVGDDGNANNRSINKRNASNLNNSIIEVGNSSEMSCKRQRTLSNTNDKEHGLYQDYHHHSRLTVASESQFDDAVNDNEEDHGSLAEANEEMLQDEDEHTTAETTVPPSKVGLEFFSDNDVLCGRGGGTNVHPGNRQFRHLINQYRRIYLESRKNDKPSISRSIVRIIRNKNGRFLKKDSKTKMWYEIGDAMAREKTSQALRQRAPEMRKILFESERQSNMQHIEELHHNQQQLFLNSTAVTNASDAGIGCHANIGSGNFGNIDMTMNMNIPTSSVNHKSSSFGGTNNHVMGANGSSGMCLSNTGATAATQQQQQQQQVPLFNSYNIAMNRNGSEPSLSNNTSKTIDIDGFNSTTKMIQQQHQQGSNPYADYSQNLMTAALLGGGINRITPHGA